MLGRFMSPLDPFVFCIFQGFGKVTCDLQMELCAPSSLRGTDLELATLE